MRRQPFHRRILPWIFAITFVGVAPALVFYTAGYRWNPKKGIIERNGTIIIDSTPSSAQIKIDGRPITDQTPITIQNMSPGMHQFEVSKTGFYPWTKTFEVIPEHVVFANAIRLWKQSTPVLSTPLTRSSIRISPDDRHALAFSNATPTQLTLIDTRNFQATTPVSIPDAIDTVDWSPTGRYVLLEPTDRQQAPWLMDDSGKQPMQLPAGRYRWEGTALVGNNTTSLISIRLTDFALSRTPLSTNHADIFEDKKLLTPTGTTDIAYVDGQHPQQGFILPKKNWNFWGGTANTTILHDGSSWLSLIKNDNAPDSHRVTGDSLRPFAGTNGTKYLLIHNTELWSWNPQAEPELLLRQSHPIIGAAWFHDGNNLFYATSHEVKALNLDTRNGRLETMLAQFDDVTDIGATSRMLFISGTKNGQTGIWSLAVE